MQTIALIDYGMGNLHSVSRALRTVAPTDKIILTDTPEDILKADRVIFPGQGAMPDGMKHLRDKGLDKVLLEACQTKPFLGICLGLQMLFEHSEEGDTPGLGLLQGRVAHLKTLQSNTPSVKIPHMGWNQVHQQDSTHPLWQSIPQDSYFYFVHSYYAIPEKKEETATITSYPSPFVSAVIRKNIVAVQFHPEKSQIPGLQLLKNFVQWMPLLDSTKTSLSAQ
jgi:imidazole glycerol-phosphate synthase subunit HisH